MKAYDIFVANSGNVVFFFFFQEPIKYTVSYYITFCQLKMLVDAFAENESLKNSLYLISYQYLLFITHTFHLFCVFKPDIILVSLNLALKYRARGAFYCETETNSIAVLK